MKDDVESMAAQARRSVTDEEGEAQHSVRDFAWRRVFDAMPGCQDLVRMEINILLDTFLEMPWGYMYVFKLGMVLDQGEWFQDYQMEDRPRNTEDERTGEAPCERFQTPSGTCSRLCGTTRRWQPRRIRPRPSTESFVRASRFEAQATSSM